MPEVATGGAMCMCSFGMAPSSLMVLPANQVMQSMPVANIMDMSPMVNVLPFAMCQSPANPQVIALTAAALGVFTPAPCIPMPAGPWMPGKPTVMVGPMPILDSTCMLMCAWGGVIQITFAGQVMVTD